MDALLNMVVDHFWPQIGKLTGLKTPDDVAGKYFTIKKISQNTVEIATEAGSSITIRREAMLEALRYLINHNHNVSNSCEIHSNQIAEQSGPLCRATRGVNSNTRVINYIVPILAAVGILAVSGTRPNSTWLA